MQIYLDWDLPDVVARSTENITYINQRSTRVYGNTVITCDQYVLINQWKVITNKQTVIQESGWINYQFEWWNYV